MDPATVRAGNDDDSCVARIGFDGVPVVSGLGVAPADYIIALVVAICESVVAVVGSGVGPADVLALGG